MTTQSKAAAAKAEATHQPIVFTYRDVEFTAPSGQEWSVDALEYLEDGMITKGLREILSAAEWAKFKALKPLANELGDFMTAMTDRAGVEGN